MDIRCNTTVRLKSTFCCSRVAAALAVFLHECVYMKQFATSNTDGDASNCFCQKYGTTQTNSSSRRTRTAFDVLQKLIINLCFTSGFKLDLVGKESMRITLPVKHMRRSSSDPDLFRVAFNKKKGEKNFKPFHVS